ncbi:hypothetical protein U9M48_037822 [Paspalum notatum var. saurae]|uniref:Uncharacterized protein n=1 Tax=Paspalum notatum var. saurae TaxID=547442 RepID=A0AAQ3UKP5_PASNO
MAMSSFLCLAKVVQYYCRVRDRDNSDTPHWHRRKSDTISISYYRLHKFNHARCSRSMHQDKQPHYMPPAALQYKINPAGVEPGDGGEEVHLPGGDDLAVLADARLLVEVAASRLVEHVVGGRVAQRGGGVVDHLRAGVARVRHGGGHHGVHHHVPRDDVHDEVEVGQEARQVLLGVADDDGVDGARALHPPGHRVRANAGDDAGPHDHHGNVAAELPQEHLAHGLGEHVRVGPPEVPGALQPQLLHRLALRQLLVVGVGGGGELLLHLSDQAQLGVEVQVRALAQRLARLDGLLQDQALSEARNKGCRYVVQD